MKKYMNFAPNIRSYKLVLVGQTGVMEFKETALGDPRNLGHEML